jgi:hypothetical protein
MIKFIVLDAQGSKLVPEAREFLVGGGEKMKRNLLCYYAGSETGLARFSNSSRNRWIID